MRIPMTSTRPQDLEEDGTASYQLSPSKKRVMQPEHHVRFIESLQSQLNDAGMAHRIRVFGLYRVSKSFDARLQCSAREYEYLLPLSMVRDACITQEGKLHRGYSFFIGGEYRDSGVLHNGLDDVDQPRCENLTPFLEDDDTESLSTTTSLTNSTFVVPPVAKKLSKEQLEQEAKEAEKRLSSLLKQYKGTHSFHNFTPGGHPSDPSMLRYIETINVQWRWLDDMEPVFVIRLKGQSFLLHQIRKMVGLAVQIMQGTSPTHAIPLCLNKNYKCDIHMSPALGLLLHRVFYTQYNEFRTNPPDVPCLDFSDLDQPLTDFRENVVYPSILRQLRDPHEGV